MSVRNELGHWKKRKKKKSFIFAVINVNSLFVAIKRWKYSNMSRKVTRNSCSG